MTQKFQRFGKYLILDHLVDGGMAKICRARFLGEQANKVVAIKMVQPQFSKDPSFVKMFQDELNVTFSLLHPNVIQVYDYGNVSDQLYTAMEYVDGVNLKQTLDRLKEKNVVFPVEISIFIISQVCQGLSYAHTFTDKLTGKPLNIVHRDISPHNIMISYDGSVKVIDFGIAKANTNSEATQAGTIKGKLSYLAPEYLEGLELDSRYDMFAVGVTFWELLCSRKLFSAANDLAVLKLIQACKIQPPSSINPNVPKELDEIVMKALSKDRNNRFENMDKFNRALVKFLYSQYPDFNPSDLSYFAKELFKEEIKKDKEKFITYSKIDFAPYIEEIKQEESRGTNQTQSFKPDPHASKDEKKESKKEEPKHEARIELDLDYGNDATSLELKRNKTATKKVVRPPGPQIHQKVVTPEHTNIVHRKDLGGSDEKSHSTRKTRITKSPDDEASSSAKSRIIFILVASLAVVAYFQGDRFESTLGFNLKKMIHSSPQRKPGSSSKIETGDMKGKVSFSGHDMSMDIVVNGTKMDYIGTFLAVPINEKLLIEVKKNGYKTFTKEIQLTKDRYSALVQIPDLTKISVGILSTSLNYPTGSKLVYYVDGEKMEKDIPFKDQQIPTGNYEAMVVNPHIGSEKKVKFNIEENKVHFLE